MPDTDQFTILIVDDDLGHVCLIERSLRRAGISNEILRFQNGQEVLDFLFKDEVTRRSGPNEPLLILLDLNMPVLDGYHVMERIRSCESTRHLPVVILTTTEDEREVTRCYELGCNVFMTKPVDYGKFSEAIRQLGLLFCVIRAPLGVKRGARGTTRGASERDQAVELAINAQVRSD